jgi:endonuclease G
VREKPYGAEFEDFAVRNPETVIDPKLIGYPVDLPEADYGINQWPGRWPRVVNPRGRVFNPLRGGISISNYVKYSYATLGGKVIDRRTRKEMILSNWHVMVGYWHVSHGAPIYQPGRSHGGAAENTIAYLTRDAMDSFIDAAVAELNGARPIINDQIGVGRVTGVIAPARDMIVTKSGSRTGVTNGVITGVEGRQVMNYDGVQRVIRSIVHIAQISDGDQVSAGGDSGSWWLEKDTNRAAGLHFAGSDVPEYALAISMPQALDALEVDIATGA